MRHSEKTRCRVSIRNWRFGEVHERQLLFRLVNCIEWHNPLSETPENWCRLYAKKSHKAPPHWNTLQRSQS